VYHGIEPSTTPGVLSINIFLSRDEVHALLRNPYTANSARHHAGNRMALDNIRERLALHFDAEASLESRVTRDTYEVHIRMPYRTTKAARIGGNASTAARRERGADAGTQKRREPTLGERRAEPPPRERRREPHLGESLPALAQLRTDHG